MKMTKKEWNLIKEVLNEDENVQPQEEIRLSPLEAVEKIGKTLLRNYDNSVNGNGYTFFSTELKIIKLALNEKELYWHYIEELLSGNYVIIPTKDEEIHCKKSLAFDIIKEKEVCVGFLLETRNLKHYNNGTLYKDYQLTQEEYDLLKEVLL